MKFTSEDLMKAMSLRIGDMVRFDLGVFEIVNKENRIMIKHVIECSYLDLENLVEQDFEILPRPKRVGDLKCDDFEVCCVCPLYFLCQWGFSIEPTLTLLENLERIEDFEKDDKEIYDLLKARLNKEVLKDVK